MNASRTVSRDICRLLARDHPLIGPGRVLAPPYRSRHRHHSSKQHSSHRYSHSQSHRSHRSHPTHLIALLPSLWYLLPSSLRPDGFSSNPDVSPHNYTTHTIHSIRRLEGGKHVLIRIELSKASREAFGRNAASQKGKAVNDERLGPMTIYHVCIKSPDLQIERPYTPINDPERDGYMDLVVKRVRGGEVGRYIHSLREAGEIEIRGPIPTVTIPLDELDELDMISTGTGIAPFLQLISRLTNRLLPANIASPSSSNTPPVSLNADPSSIPNLNLLHYLPSPLPSSSTTSPIIDLATDPSLLPQLQQAWTALGPTLEGKLRVRRVEAVEGGVGGETGVREGRVQGWRDILAGASPGAAVAAHDSRESIATAVEKTWWQGLWASSSAPVSTEKVPPVESGAVQVSPNRGVITCLPQKMLTPLVGPRYPLVKMRKDAKLEGVLGEMGFGRERVWVL